MIAQTRKADEEGFVENLLEEVEPVCDDNKLPSPFPDEPSV
jgi:hypothetical protein